MQVCEHYQAKKRWANLTSHPSSSQGMESDWQWSAWSTERNRWYKYIVTAVDYISKYVEAQPLQEKTGETEVKFLQKLLCQYGSCDTHVTD